MRILFMIHISIPYNNNNLRVPYYRTRRERHSAPVQRERERKNLVYRCTEQTNVFIFVYMCVILFLQRLGSLLMKLKPTVFVLFLYFLCWYDNVVRVTRVVPEVTNNAAAYSSALRCVACIAYKKCWPRRKKEGFFVFDHQSSQSNHSSSGE